MITNALSTIITNKIQKKYGLDNSEYLIITALITGFFSYLTSINHAILLNTYYKYVLGILCVLCILLFVGICYKIFMFKSKKPQITFVYENEQSIIIDAVRSGIIDTNYLKVGYKVIKNHTKNFITISEIVFSNDIIVNDDKNNLYGIIKSKEIVCTIPPTTKEELSTKITTTRITFTADNYDHDVPFDILIRQLVEKSRKATQTRKLIYVKIFYDTFIHNIFYHQSKDKYKSVIESNIDKYFNSNVSILKNAAKTQSYHIKNFILYGEPGTGKSKFINLFAQTIQASIISINLLDFAKCKSNLYKLFNMQLCNQPKKPSDEFPGLNTLFGRKSELTDNVCIVLEEIDYSIKMLLALEKYRNDERKMKNIIHNNEDKIVIVKKDEPINNDLLEVSDLLELFQGLIEYPKRYIFATTNNFDDIKSIIPALFRNGRMTPINITFMTWNDLQNCVKYYYPDDILTIPKTDIQISSSTIIQLAETSKVDDLPFEEFEKKLNAIIN